MTEAEELSIAAKVINLLLQIIKSKVSAARREERERCARMIEIEAELYFDNHQNLNLLRLVTKILALEDEK